MANIISYPGNDASGLPLLFSQLINDVSKTKLIVLGTDVIAVNARDFINQRIAADPDDYVSVSFIFVTQPPLVLADLKTLPVNLKNPTHLLNWDNYPNYRVFAVSAGNRMISDVITANELNDAYGSIDSAILFAISNG